MSDVGYLTKADLELLRFVTAARVEEVDFSDFYVEEEDVD
jgi:hypothetical protein